jgi:glycosyltransferase involved in cell wall biosynthesis
LGYGDSAVERVGDALRRWKVDVIHAVDASAAELARKVADQQGVPYLVSSFDLADARRLSPAAESAELLLAGSQPIADALASHRRRAEGPIRLFRPGVYQVRHATCFQEPDNSVAVVTGGRGGNFRALAAVLQCLAELASRQLDCVLFVVASGPVERRLRRRAARLGLGQRITFVDAMPTAQLARIFQDADVYITPAPQKSIDMHSLLAMAAGVPVLAAGPSGANDFLRDGQTVRGFACGDAAELTERLAGMLDDRAGARALAESALEYLREHHSPAGNVAALAGMYREVLGSRAQASGSRLQASGTAEAPR